MTKLLQFAGGTLAATLAASVLAIALTKLPSAAQSTDAITAPGERLVATLHAEGAQVYECKAGVSGTLAWQFREPVATLVEDGVTVGRHYAGPAWELTDGSVVVAKAVGRTPGAGPKDIPLLKLEVTSRQGAGRLSEIATIQRLNTKGGVAEGACETAGVLLSMPYSADYALLKKPD
jgi:hypothetical protein